MYDQAIQSVADKLLPILPVDKQRVAVARVLVLACNHGAGDAMAGYILKDVSREVIAAIALLLGLDYVPRFGGPTACMLLLSAKASDERVAAVLGELDHLSAAGKGC